MIIWYTLKQPSISPEMGTLFTQIHKNSLLAFAIKIILLYWKDSFQLHVDHWIHLMHMACKFESLCF